jgi:hypothetical protein
MISAPIYFGKKKVVQKKNDKIAAMQRDDVEDRK